MEALYLCGGRLQLIGSIPEGYWTDETEAFRALAPYGFSHELTLIEVSDPSLVVPPEEHFVYQRKGLTFGSHAGRSTLWHDGRGSVSAGMELALSQAVRAEGGLLLHSSAGVVGAECWVMPGPSGAGKSTAARGGFDRVLSDERVAILPDGDGYRVWATPFWSKGRSLVLSTGSAPLGVLARLNKAKLAKLDEESRGDMVTWLLRSVVLYDISESAQLAAFELACRIVGVVDCVKLDFPKEGVWVPSLIKRTSRAS
jgi:hypothetical protein